MPRWGPFFLLAIALLRSAVADAPAEARRRFDEGVKAYDAGRFEEALEAFRAAQAARPAPVISRNIALALAKLGRNAEAIVALERAIAEGGADGAVAARTLADLKSKAATARVAIVVNVVPGTQAPAPRLSLDGAELPADRALAEIWLDPGEHIFAARAEGFDGDERTLRVVAGDRDVPVTLSLAPHAPSTGAVSVTTNVASAAIKIDGERRARGRWHGQLVVGKHRVEAEARGYTSAMQEVEVSERSEEAVSLELREIPGAFVVPPPSSGWYLAGGVGAFGGELPDRGGGVPIGSFTFGARLGRRYGPYIGLEIDGELVRGTAQVIRGPIDLEYVYTHAALGPGVRFFTAEGSPRFTAAAIGGVLNQSVYRSERPSGASSTAGAPSGFLQIEAGGQVDFSRTIGLELVAFVGMFGVNDREHLTGTVMSRAGARLALSFSF